MNKLYIHACGNLYIHKSQDNVGKYTQILTPLTPSPSEIRSAMANATLACTTIFAWIISGTRHCKINVINGNFIESDNQIKILRRIRNK